MDERRQALIGELARAIGFVAAGRDDEAADIIRTVAKGVDVQRALPGITPAEPKVNADDGRKATAGGLFRYWQTECGHQAAKPTPERISKVIARLRDGYTAAEIRKAIDGAKHGAYENDGKRYDDLELICRNGSKLEAFIARGELATGAIEVADVATAAGPLEDQIAKLRRTMATLRKEGRDTEYEAHAKDLQALMAKRELTPTNLRGNK